MRSVPDPERMVEVVRRWWDEVWGEADTGPIDELVADRYVRHSASGTRVLTREELKADMAQYFRVLHKPTTTVDDRAVAADRVWSRLTSRGVDLETGELRTVTWLQVHRFDDTCRICETWLLYADGVDWNAG